MTATCSLAVTASAVCTMAHEKVNSACNALLLHPAKDANRSTELSPPSCFLRASRGC